VNARRVSAACRPPFGVGMPVPIRAPSSWFLTTSTVSSSSTLRPFSGRCRSWGSSRFFPPRSGNPRNAPTALRSFSSADSYVNRRRIPVPAWARVTLATVSGRSVHREPCPLVLFLPVKEAGTSRFFSVFGSVARGAVASLARPVLPWACPIRSSPRRTACPNYRRDVRVHSEKWALRSRLPVTPIPLLRA